MGLAHAENVGLISMLFSQWCLKDKVYVLNHEMILCVLFPDL